MSAPRTFQTFPHGHQDLVLAVDYNFYGDRLVTASSDHRLKVWDKKGDSWTLVDSWKAHDAEVTEVKWNGPFVGQVLGSIGEDGYLRLWEEDISQASNSGRRFRQIMNPLLSKSRLPWMSLDFKNISTETYLALITRDGNLSILEPKDHDNLSGEWTDWMENQDFLVCPKPPLSEETSFRVCFHHEKLPCWTAIAAGLDRKAVSIAVAAMNTVKVYRTDRERRLYLAAELKGARDIVRDVAWANGSMRGFDVLATASTDGAVRVYELRSESKEAANGPSDDPNSTLRKNGDQSKLSRTNSARKVPSGIGAGLAGTSGTTTQQQEDDGDPSRVKQTVEMVAELTQHQGAVWRVKFSYTGDLLTSTGDDGSIRTWKRGISNKWFEYAEINAKFGG